MKLQKVYAAIKVRVPFIRLLLVLLVVVLFGGGCVAEKGTMDTADAWSEVLAAIDYKARECGNRPGYILLVPDNPVEYGTHLCSLTILRMKCPFRDYPLFCFEMYNVDVPFIGP